MSKFTLWISSIMKCTLKLTLQFIIDLLWISLIINLYKLIIARSLSLSLSFKIPLLFQGYMNYLKGSTHLHLSADDKDRLFGNLLQIYEFSRYEFSWYSNICGIKRDGSVATAFSQIHLLIRFQIYQLLHCNIAV